MTTILDHPDVVALQRRGYAVRATDLTKGGSSRPSKAELEIDVVLPKPTALAASFAPEKAHHRLVKLLREEIQTGDAEFDAVVYISTDTAKQARALLAEPRARQIIQRIVAAGGSISCEGRTLVIVQLAPTPADAHLHGDEIAWLTQQIADV